MIWNNLTEAENIWWQNAQVGIFVTSVLSVLFGFLVKLILWIVFGETAPGLMTCVAYGSIPAFLLSMSHPLIRNDLAKLKAEAEEGKAVQSGLVNSANRLGFDSLTMRANKWIVQEAGVWRSKGSAGLGGVGLSSKAIWAVMMGVPVDFGFGDTHPRDPSDFDRCVKLLNLCPEWRSRMSEMREVSPKWAALVEEWDSLESRYPIDGRSGSGRSSHHHGCMMAEMNRIFT